MNTLTVNLPTAVEQIQIPHGFTLRPATHEDIPAIIAAFNAEEMMVTGIATHTVEKFANEWTHPKFDVAYSTRVIVEEASGQVVGYASVWDTEPLPVSNWVNAVVHPDFMGRGLGTALHHWIHVRLQDTLARVPEDVQVDYHCGAMTQHDSAHALFESLGMQKVRYFWRMVIEIENKELPEPQIAAGFVIRPWSEVLDSISLRDVASAAEEAFRDHWGHVDQPLDEIMSDWQHWVENTPDMGPDTWFLLIEEATNEVAGVSLCRRKARNNPAWGYLDTLGIRREYRQKGLALALLHYTFRYFQQEGFTQVELHVDASSLTGATRLYERAGMHVGEEEVGYRQVLRHGRDLSVQTLEG
jgi:mycothiol synthase